MIKINKPEQPPEVLLSKGKAKRHYLCASYSRYSAEYISGKRTFNFDSGVYGHETVRVALAQAQHNKCCFCEAWIGLDGDVEHFRPKGACRQSAKERLNRPGYYWLAYDWTNLLFACPICNQRYKKNLFPLADPTHRAKSHRQKIALEEPLLIHPAEQDPESFIGFREEVPYAIDGNLPGKTTIKILGLNRESQNENRRERLQILQELRNIVKLEAQLVGTDQGMQTVASAKATLLRAVNASAPYASMARANRLNVF